MISKENVLEYIKTLGGFSDDDLLKYNSVIDFSIMSTFENLKDKSFETDERAVFLSAAKAFYFIAFSLHCENVYSFTAGDVSVTEQHSPEYAKEILDKAYSAAGSLIKDGGFAFIGV
ncbi:MAG: hypothetical protein LUG21_04120 [Clostridiales bacterium]|nr:hypothetical protein [Clostridiales bacterium]